MEINIGDIIGKPSEHDIIFTPGVIKSIQMPYEYLIKTKEIGHNKGIFIFESSMPVHKRLSIEAHLKFMIKWYNRSIKTEDLLKQYQLEDYKKTALAKLPQEINQRLSYIHSVVTNQQFIMV